MTFKKPRNFTSPPKHKHALGCHAAARAVSLGYTQAVTPFVLCRGCMEDVPEVPPGGGQQ